MKGTEEGGRMRRPVWGTPTFGRDVQSMFTAISGSYSLFDHVSTFGGDLIWRPRALWGADRLSEGSPRRILDIGCGPGDLTRLLPQHYPGAEVYGLDFTPAMVHRAAGISARRSGPTQPAGFLAGDALHLPFRASTFDMVTSAFLLRNLPDLRAGFAEMRRVLRPGGTFLALDVTEPPPGAFYRFFHAYFDAVVPTLGAAFGNPEAYHYLSTSIRHLPPRKEVVELLGSTGFSPARAEPQWMGIITGFLGKAAKGV